VRGDQLRRDGTGSCVFCRLSPLVSLLIESLTYQLPLLASTSNAPVLHHLSSVAATVPAPSRTIYAATKAAALMAVESCRVECEGCGVRFFCK
jgi:NADP-dependent 3-hydroxy acid dehydrogenase YdfG